MPFGLCNAPATFERLMSQVMRGLHWKRCLVYIDDILVFGNDFEAVLHNLELVLDRVAEYGLQLKSTKCNLFRTSVSFLGHIVLAYNATRVSCLQLQTGSPHYDQRRARIPGVHGILQTICSRLLHGGTSLGTFVGKRL